MSYTLSIKKNGGKGDGTAAKKNSSGYYRFNLFIGSPPVLRVAKSLRVQKEIISESELEITEYYIQLKTKLKLLIFKK